MHALARQAFSEEEFEKLGVMGAEWWYQDRKPDEDIGFHYDKDESIASNKMRMVYPYVEQISVSVSVSLALSRVLSCSHVRSNLKVP